MRSRGLIGELRNKPRFPLRKCRPGELTAAASLLLCSPTPLPYSLFASRIEPAAPAADKRNTGGEELGSLPGE